MKIIFVLWASAVACCGQAFSFLDPAMIGQTSVVAASAPACTTTADGYAVDDGNHGALWADTQARWYASSFVAGASYTTCKAVVDLNKHGSPASDVTVCIYSDNGGVPGTLLATSDAVNSSTFSASTTPSACAVTFANLSAALTQGTIYWIVLKGAADWPNSPGFFYTEAGGAIYMSYNSGSTWSVYQESNPIGFRLYK